MDRRLRRSGRGRSGRAAATVGLPRLKIKHSPATTVYASILVGLVTLFIGLLFIRTVAAAVYRASWCPRARHRDRRRASRPTAGAGTRPRPAGERFQRTYTADFARVKLRSRRRWTAGAAEGRSDCLGRVFAVSSRRRALAVIFRPTVATAA